MNFIFISVSVICALVLCSSCTQSANFQLQSDSSAGILGGQSVPPTDRNFKSVVGLLMIDGASLKAQAICTGTLINENVILTAAHCVYDAPAGSGIVAVFDEKVFRKDREVTVRIIKRVLPHEDYDTKSYKNANDVALMQFEGTMPEGYRPAPLLEVPQFLRHGTVLTVAGYGRQSIFDSEPIGELMFTNVKIKNLNFSKGEFVTTQFLRGVCSGDSGGPAFVEINDVWHVAGVINRVGAFGPLSCIRSAAVLNVEHYKNWIKQGLRRLR